MRRCASASSNSLSAPRRRHRMYRCPISGPHPRTRPAAPCRSLQQKPRRLPGPLPPPSDRSPDRLPLRPLRSRNPALHQLPRPPHRPPATNRHCRLRSPPHRRHQHRRRRRRHRHHYSSSRQPRQRRRNKPEARKRVDSLWPPRPAHRRLRHKRRPWLAKSLLRRKHLVSHRLRRQQRRRQVPVPPAPPRRCLRKLLLGGSRP